MNLKIGDKLKFSQAQPCGSVVTYRPTVVKIDGDTCWIEYPKSVLVIPFPPNGGKRFAKYRISDIERFVEAKTN